VQPRQVISLLSDSEDDFSTSKLQRQSVSKPSQLSKPIDFTKSNSKTNLDFDSDESLPTLSELFQKTLKSNSHSKTDLTEVKDESSLSATAITKTEE
jgi:hypothetical protein